MSNTRHFAEITNLRDKLRRGLAMLTVASMLMPSGGLASEGTNQGKLKCILPEHTHSEACYETAVICGEEERQPEIVREFTGTFPVHVHKADCYDSEGKLICGMVEKEYYHTHSEFCRDTEGNLVCGLQSQPKHSHTEDCRDGEGNLICGLNPDWPVFTTSAENWKETVKDPGHQHTEACYETKLICGLEEHTHTDECYETVMPVSAVSGELQEVNKDQTKPEGDDSGENEENDLEEIEEGLEKTVEEVVDFISGHEEHQNGADQNPENAEKSSEELEQTEVENENPVKDKAETDEEPTVPQENGQEEEREKEPREEERGDGVTGEGEPEGVEPEDKVTGSEEPGSGEKTGKEEPAADGEEVNPLNPTPTDGAVIIETEQNPEGQPVEQVQTPEENVEQEIEKIENQGTENPEASPEQNPDKQEPADEEGQADEQEPADEEEQADEQEPADEEAQADEQEPADEEAQADEQEPADEEKQADVVNPDGDPSDGESADEETEPVEEPVKFFEGTKVFEGPDYTVTATIGADACFPEDIELAVREILPGTDEYRMYSGQTADAATDEWSEIGEFARFFDITFLSGGAEVEPQAFIDVQITFREAIPVAEDADVQAIHFSEDGANVIESSTDSVEAAASDPDAVDTVNFTVDSFSVYGFFQRVVITTRVITAGGQTYRVEVTYGQDAGIPEGAVLSASEIRDGDEDYELYRAQAAAALEAGHVEMPGLYDISILDAEGQKVQPQGPVSVSITLENGLESEDIKVVHFPEGIEAARTEADGAAGETEEEKKRITEVTPEAAEKPVVAVEVISPEVSEQTVTFETDGFSVYALAYTVDFHYEGVDYSIEGNSQILLSELIQMLNVQNAAGERIAVADVASVSFSDAHLVTVQQVSGLITYNEAENVDVGEKDFLLSSEQAFSTDENLTIELNDGEKIHIGVTDSQSAIDLKPLLDSAVITINNTPVTGNNWSVIAGDEYKIKLAFVEKTWLQFADDNTPMTYKLPAGIQPKVTSGTFPMTVSIYGRTYTLPDNSFSVDASGLLTIQWNTGTTPQEQQIFGYLNSSDNARIDIDIYGSIPNATGPIIFSDTVTKTVEVKQPHDVGIAKTGSYDATTGKVNYTLTVTSKGVNENVVITDTMDGTALVFDNNVSVSGNASTVGTVPEGNGFKTTLSQMADGETVTITYSATVDKTKIAKSGSATYDETKNAVTVTIPNDDNPSNNEATSYQHDIAFSNLTKETTTISDITPENGRNYKTVHWKIVTNENPTVSLAGSKIIDRNQSSDKMSYLDGITVTKYDANGAQVSSETITFGTNGLTQNGNNSWEYTIPSTDTAPYKYVIEYDTKVDVTNQPLDLAVSNGADGKGGTDGGNYIIGGDGNNNQGGGDGGDDPQKTVSINKLATSIVGDKVTWRITVPVPAESYTTDFVITDYLPYVWHGDSDGTQHHWVDELYSDAATSISVSGIEGKESYTATISNYKDAPNALVKIQFYKNQEKTEKGLTKIGENGKGRVIEVVVETKLNHDWMDYGRTLLAADPSSESYYLVHTNKAKVEADGLTAEKEARISPREKDIRKVKPVEYNETYITVTDNGSDISCRAYLYKIILSNVKQDQVVVKDAFDTSIFGIGTTQNIPGYFSLLCQTADQYAATQAEGFTQENCKKYGAAIPTSTGADLIIDIPRRDDGGYADFYHFTYYLYVKPGAESLIYQLAAQNGGTTTLTNTASWEGKSSSATVDFTYQGLKKEQTAFDNATKIGTYRITLNPNKLQLNGGSPLKMTDTMQNLSIIYASVNFETEPAGRESQITFDYRGNVGTFMIPDETKVIITYDAQVIGTPDTTISYSNTAEMAGFIDGFEGQSTFGADISGSASVYNLNLFKYKAGHMEVGLNNAVFQLFDENKNPILDRSGNPITFTTQKTTLGGTSYNAKDGYVQIILNKSQYGVALQKDTRYYLKEIQLPDNTYALDNTYYGFMISDTADYSQYIYHNNDTLKVYNTLKKGQLQITKTIEGAANLTQKQKEAITFVVERTDVASNTENYYKKEFTYADFTSGVYKLEDLPVGTYKVEETSGNIAGYTLSATTVKVDSGDDASGTSASGLSIVENSAKQVEFKNTYTSNGAKITVVKVDSKETPTKHLFGAEFQLLKKNGEEYQPLTTNAALDTNGKFVISYANKEGGITVSGLEDGDYRLKETKAPTGYVALVEQIDFSVSNGTVTYSGGISAVEFASDTFTIKNEKEHSYTFTKIVSEGVVTCALPGAVFGVFNASSDQEIISERFTTDASGKGMVAKKGDNFADNTLYYVKEITAPTGYTLNNTKYYFAFGTVESAGVSYANLIENDATVDVADTPATKSITVTKSWTDSQTVITSVNFKIKQTATYADDTEPTTEDYGEPYTITSADSWTRTVSGLPAAGIKNGKPVTFSYSVEEVPVDGYTSVVSGDEGTGFTITNQPVGDLTITKSVTGTGADTNKDFTFTVTLTNRTDVASESFNTVDQANQAGTLAFTNGVASFTLKHGQSLTIKDLPAGTTYTVTETADADYTSSQTVSSTIDGETTHGTISAGETETVDFTNTKTTPGEQSVDITLIKNWNDPNAENGHQSDAPADGSVTFQLHQKKTTTTSGGTGGSVTVQLLAADKTTVLGTVSGNVGDLIVFSFNATPYNGTNISVYRAYYYSEANNGYHYEYLTHAAADNDGNGSLSYTIVNGDVIGGKVTLALANNIDGLANVTATNNSGGSSTTQIEVVTDPTGSGYPKTITLSDPTWSYSGNELTNLPIRTVSGGTVITYAYWLVETARTGAAADYNIVTYAADAGKDEEHPITTSGSVSVTVTNSKPELTTVNATKEWKDQKDQTLTWPEGRTVTLGLYVGDDPVLVGGQPLTVELDNTPETEPAAPTAPYAWESAAGTATFAGLPKYQAGTSTLIAYTVKETAEVTGFAATVTDNQDGTFTITNKKIETVNITATKAWSGVDAARQPTAIQFTLLRTSTTDAPVAFDAPVQVIAKPDSGNWPTAEWTDLPKYVDETAETKVAYEYTVEETGVYFGTLTEDDPGTDENEGGQVPSGAVFAAPSMYTVSGGEVTFTYAEHPNNGTASITNAPVTVNVPVEKTWAAFTDSQYTWTATFQLEELETKVSGEDASDAIRSYTPISGKTITISKGQTENITFDNLPMYRVHSNGSVYRIVYAAEETAYTVRQGETVVAHWEKGNDSATVGTVYSPQYTQDAGDVDRPELADNVSEWYKIKVSNTVENKTIQETLDIHLTKTWESGSFDNEDYGNVSENDAFATFELVRYLKEAHRDYSTVSNMSDTATVTLNGYGSITVPKGVKVYLTAQFKAGPDGNGAVTFTQNNPYYSLTIGHYYNASESETLRSDDFITVNEDITLTPSNSDVNKIHSASLTDLGPYGSESSQVIDTVTLSKASNNWTANWTALPKYAEDEFDQATKTQTVYYYSYELREVQSQPANFYPTFTVSGSDAGTSYRIENTTSLTATNKPIPKFIVRKVWRGIPDASSMPEIKFTLYQWKQNEEARKAQAFVDSAGIEYSGIALNKDNQWTWTCPVYLPTTVNGQTVKYYVKEDVTSGGEGIYAWEIYSYSNAFDQTLDNGKGDYLNATSDGGAEPWLVAISGNEGEIIIHNRMGGGYINLDIKKKFVQFTDQGWETWTQDTATIWPNTVLGFKVIRKAYIKNENDEWTSLTGWMDYGDEMLCGYDAGGNAIQDNGTNDFDLAHQSPWHWRITNVNSNPNSQTGLPKYGYYVQDGVTYNVAWSYSVRETDVYMDLDRTPYPDWQWNSTLTPQYAQVHWDSDKYVPDYTFYPNTPHCGDPDRINNYQAANLEVSKEWLGSLTDVDATKVFVKIWRKTGSGTVEDFTEVIADDITGNQNWQQYVKDTSVIDTTNNWLILTEENNWTTTIKIDRALIAEIMSGGADSIRYTYYLEEVGYEDASGTHSISDSSKYGTRYKKWNGTAWENTTYANGIDAGTTISTVNNNKLRVVNAPAIINLNIIKAWYENDGTTEMEPEEGTTATIKIRQTYSSASDWSVDPQTRTLTFRIGSGTASESLTISKTGKKYLAQVVNGSQGEYTLTEVSETGLQDWSLFLDGMQKMYTDDDGTVFYCKYEIIEAEAQGFSLIRIDGNPITTSDQTVTVQNKESQKAYLLVKKAISGLEAADVATANSKEYKFTVRGANGKYYAQDGTESDTAVELTVTAGSTAGTLISNIPAGQSYTVTEITEDGEQTSIVEITGYTFSGVTYSVENGQTASLTVDNDENNPAEVTMTNTYMKLTSISAKKTWSGSETWPENMSVTFTLSATANGSAYTIPAGIEINKTVASADENKTVTWQNLPKWTVVNDATVEIIYSVTETAVTYNETAMENYRTVYTVSGEGTGTNGLVNINNTPKTVDLTVNKEWFQNNVQLTGESFLPNATITVNVEKSEDNGTTWAVAVDPANNQAITGVTLGRADNWSKTWNALPAYTITGTAIQYRVTETAAKVNTTDSLDVTSQTAVAFTNGTATLTNNLPTRNIVVEKAWSPTGWPSDIESVTVGLYKTVNGTETPVTTGDPAAYWTITFISTSEAGSRTFSNLPVYDAASGTAIVYSVKEISVTPAGGTAQSVTDGAVTANGKTWTVLNGAVSDAGTATVTNTLTGISIQVTKQWTKGDSAKTTATSISFELHQVLTPDSGNPIDRKYTDYSNATAGITSGDGTVTYNTENGNWNTVTIPDLPLTVTESATTGEGQDAVTVQYTASYYVKETQATADAGYVLATTYSTDNGTTSVTEAKDATVSTNNAKITIINTETAGVELPATGGSGTLIYTVAGMGLIVLAGMLLVSRKRKYNR